MEPKLISEAKIAEATGKARDTVHRQITKLAREGLIQPAVRGNRRRSRWLSIADYEVVRAHLARDASP